jgi:hypothetical protein
MKKLLNTSVRVVSILMLVAGCGSSPVAPTQTLVATTQASTPIPAVDTQSLPNTGQQISPLAVPGSTFESMNPGLADNPDWLAGQAVTSVVSPDKKIMLVLTSGYNRVYRTDGVMDALGTYFNWPDSQEYVFIYDISTNTPVKKQVVMVPNTYNGIAFDPSGMAFYVSSGKGDIPFDSTGAVNPAKSAGDNVHIFSLNTATGTWGQTGQLLLGHTSGNGLDVQPPTGEQRPPTLRVAVSPWAAGIAVSIDGMTLVVDNYFHDSITVFTGGLGNWSK